jgi:hypothetical protein
MLLGGLTDEAVAALVVRGRSTFLDFAEEPHEVSEFFDPDTLARLRGVKGRYDPRDLIRAHQPVRPPETASS